MTYANHRIPQPLDRLTPAEKLELIEIHPLFSGRCPACELPIAFAGQAKGDWRCGFGWREDYG